MKAFPVPRYVNSDGETWDSAIQGMDLRDYFAAKIIGDLIVVYKDAVKAEVMMGDITKRAYQYADAMMIARER